MFLFNVRQYVQQSNKKLNLTPQKTINESWEAVKILQSTKALPDSALRLFESLKNNSFKQFIKQNHLSKNNLPNFLMAMGITSQLFMSIKQLDSKLKSFNDIDPNNYIDTSMVPLQFAPSECINTSDSIPLKIMIATYDSTGTIPDSLFKKE